MWMCGSNCAGQLWTIIRLLALKHRRRRSWTSIGKPTTLGFSNVAALLGGGTGVKWEPDGRNEYADVLPRGTDLCVCVALTERREIQRW